MLPSRLSEESEMEEHATAEMKTVPTQGADTKQTQLDSQQEESRATPHIDRPIPSRNGHVESKSPSIWDEADLSATSLKSRLLKLQKQLELENPVLGGVVKSFRQLDAIAYRMGLLPRDRSFAEKIPWWPLISILGTFSAGKSSFVNHYLGMNVQRCGNQAVDDKFTVLCYSADGQPRVLPGIALDTDLRFPFFGISAEIDKVEAGEGKRIDSYLQLKTCASEALRGLILIDSPGFDADAQRTATLRIAVHMIDLSDLVLVFFDARHPEPGAMRDTLQHLVKDCIKRSDSQKFLYILNQMDCCSNEDNPEEIVAAWQRALSAQGLSAGRFYCIYNPDLAAEFAEADMQKRFETKRDRDLAEIHLRMQEVEVSRSYRLVASLEQHARAMRNHAVPKLITALGRWRKRVIISDLVLLGLILIASLVASIRADYWDGFHFSPPWWQDFVSKPWLWVPVTGTLCALALFFQKKIRSFWRNIGKRELAGEASDPLLGETVIDAYMHSTRTWRPLFLKKPAGWNQGAKKRMQKVVDQTHGFVQALNRHYANPNG